MSNTRLIAFCRRHEALPRVLVAGMVIGLLSIASAIAYAGLIFGGRLSAGLAVGVSMVLSGYAVASLVVAWGSSHPGTIASPFATAAVVYPVIARALEGMLPPTLDAELQVTSIAMVCGLATAIAGIAFLLIGRLRLGSLARLLPYPVISGYNAGSGWLFIAGALGLTVGGSLPGPATSLAIYASQLLACIALGGLMVGLSRWRGHWSVVPLLLLGGGGLFHLLRLIQETGMAQAAADGWLLGPFPPGLVWASPSVEAAARISWHELPRVISAPVLTVILLGGTSAIMFLTGIELELHRRLNLDREMTVIGWANVLGGLVGGLASGHSVTGTSLAHRMNAEYRSVGVVVAGCCVAVLLLGSGTLGYIPRFVVGALLMANGVDRLIDRILLDRVKLPLHEWLLVVTVLLAVILMGYVQGVMIGLGMTLLIFAWNYRRISVVRGITTGVSHRSSIVRSQAEQAVLARDGGTVRICRLQGYLFFLNASDILQTVLRMARQTPAPRVLILDCQHVVGMDTSACLVFRQLHQLTTETGIAMMLTNLPAPMRVQLAQQHIATAYPDALLTSETTDQALEAAEEMLLAEAGLSARETAIDLAAMLSRVAGYTIPPARLAPYLEHVHFPAGAVLMRQGEPADAMYLIEQGQVMARLERPGMAPVRLRSSTAGTIVGEVAIYAGGKRTATVIAERACEAARLSVAAISRMQRDDPALAGTLHRCLAAMLAEKLADTNRMLDRSLE